MRKSNSNHMAGKCVCALSRGSHALGYEAIPLRSVNGVCMVRSPWLGSSWVCPAKEVSPLAEENEEKKGRGRFPQSCWWVYGDGRGGGGGSRWGSIMISQTARSPPWDRRVWRGQMVYFKEAGMLNYSWKPSMGASCWGKRNCWLAWSTWGARLLSSSSTPK